MSWCTDAPEDEAISLFAGLLANPDVPLSRRTSRTFPFNKCHKTVHRNSLIAYCHCPTRVVRGSRFMCVVYGFQLLVKVWFVFIVLVLDVLGLLR